VKEICIQQGVSWAGSLAKTVCNEQEYYEDLIKTYKGWTRVSSGKICRQTCQPADYHSFSWAYNKHAMVCWNHSQNASVMPPSNHSPETTQTLNCPMTLTRCTAEYTDHIIQVALLLFVQLHFSFTITCCVAQQQRCQRQCCAQKSSLLQDNLMMLLPDIASRTYTYWYISALL
jgi:hypothetical protein